MTSTSPVFEAARAAVCAGLNHSEDRNGHRFLNGVEGERAGGVAGYDEELSALFADEELCALDGVACDGAARFGAVRQARCVADEGEAGVGDLGRSEWRTVRPPKPESKTPMWVGLFGDRSWFVSFGGHRFVGQVGAGQVGVTGEGGARLAIDQETNLRDAGQVGVERSADGEDGESLGFEAGGVAGCEGARQIDNGELGIWIWGACCLPRAAGRPGYRGCSAAERGGRHRERRRDRAVCRAWLGRELRDRPEAAASGPGYEGVFVVVGNDQSGLFGWGHLGGLSGR